MIPQSRAANRGAFAQGGLPSGEVVRAVWGICARHPFPLSQHKYSHRRHGAYVHRFGAERGIDPRGRTFGDSACGTGPMMVDYVREFPETSFTVYDISRPSVELVNQTLGEEGITNAHAYVQGITALRMTGYYDVAAHSTSAVFAAMAEKLPLESQCRVIEMIVRPYRLSLVAEESGG